MTAYENLMNLEETARDACGGDAVARSEYIGQQLGLPSRTLSRLTIFSHHDLIEINWESSDDHKCR
jgi:hypothetical protein